MTENNDFKCSNKLKLDNNTHSKRKTPNWFLAIPFDNLAIRSNIKLVQEHIIHKEPKLIEACIPVEKSHLSLFVFHTDNVEKVIELLTPILQNYEFPETEIKVDSLGHFRHQVLFAHLKNFDEHLRLLWTKIGKCLMENNIISSKDAQIENFKPHITIMKLSKMETKKISKIQPELHKEFNNHLFGVQPLQKIEVLSRTHPIQSNGNYHCQHIFSLV